MKIGDKVKVIRAGDEFCDLSRINDCGHIVSAVTNDHGATEDDPFWVVEFETWMAPSRRKSSQGKAGREQEFQRKRDGFWTEELEILEVMCQ